MKVLRVYLENEKAPKFVGRLVYDRGVATFQYDPNYLATGINLSPFQLELDKKLQQAERHPFQGLHGVFDDSLPDGWGRLLMDRKLKEKGIDISETTPIERLAFMGDRGMGALSYLPDTGSENDPDEPFLVSISSLAKEAQEVMEGDVKTVSKQLYITGGSPQGARPKATLALSGDKALAGVKELPEGFTYWLVKFPSTSDIEGKNEGAVEYVFSQIAKDAGVDMPDTRLIPADDCPGYFAIKRFDRTDDGMRVHMHSLAGMIHSNFRTPDCDYEMLLDVTQQVTKSQKEVTEAYRRMVLNVLIGNRDDHTKNFAFLMNNDGTWRFSPAYDVTHSVGIAGEHTMTIAGKGKNITVDHMLKTAKGAGIPEKDARDIINKVAAAVSQFPTLAKSHGIHPEEVKRIGGYIEKQLKSVGVEMPSPEPEPTKTKTRAKSLK